MTIPSMSRADRVREIVAESNDTFLKTFSFHEPPLRYLAVEIDEIDGIVEAQQADTLLEIAKLLENSKIQSVATEIYDLDSRDILYPDFERIYRVPRIYLNDIVVYRAYDELEKPGPTTI